MNTPDLPQWLVRLAVVVAVPTMACFGYYSLETHGDARGYWTLPVVLAYPAALMGLIAFVAALTSRRRSRGKLWLSALCFIVPSVFLLLLRS
jgi:hypothetical protein